MDNLNLDIDTYSLEDLSKLFNLKDEYNEIDIDNEKQTLLSQLGEMINIGVEKKRNITFFIDSAAGRLITLANDKKTDENQGTWSQLKNDTIQEGSHTIIENPNIKAGQVASFSDGRTAGSNNTPPGFLNPINVKSIARGVNIDSRFRDNYYSTHSHDYVVSLPDTYRKVTEMRIGSIELPMTMYAISKHSGNNTFVIKNTLNNNAWLLTVPDGNYEISWQDQSVAQDIITTMNQAISMAIPGTIDECGKFVIDLSMNPLDPTRDICYTIDRNTGRSIFANVIDKNQDNALKTSDDIIERIIELSNNELSMIELSMIELSMNVYSAETNVEYINGLSCELYDTSYNNLTHADLEKVYTATRKQTKIINNILIDSSYSEAKKLITINDIVKDVGNLNNTLNITDASITDIIDEANILQEISENIIYNYKNISNKLQKLDDSTVSLNNIKYKNTEKFFDALNNYKNAEVHQTKAIADADENKKVINNKLTYEDLDASTNYHDAIARHDKLKDSSSVTLEIFKRYNFDNDNVDDIILKLKHFIPDYHYTQATTPTKIEDLDDCGLLETAAFAYTHAQIDLLKNNNDFRDNSINDIEKLLIDSNIEYIQYLECSAKITSIKECLNRDNLLLNGDTGLFNFLGDNHGLEIIKRNWDLIYPKIKNSWGTNTADDKENLKRHIGAWWFGKAIKIDDDDVVADSGGNKAVTLDVNLIEPSPKNCLNTYFFVELSNNVYATNFDDIDNYNDIVSVKCKICNYFTKVKDFISDESAIFHDDFINYFKSTNYFDDVMNRYEIEFDHFNALMTNLLKALFEYDTTEGGLGTKNRWVNCILGYDTKTSWATSAHTIKNITQNSWWGERWWKKKEPNTPNIPMFYRPYQYDEQGYQYSDQNSLLILELLTDSVHEDTVAALNATGQTHSIVIGQKRQARTEEDPLFYYKRLAGSRIDLNNPKNDPVTGHEDNGFSFALSSFKKGGYTYLYKFVRYDFYDLHKFLDNYITWQESDDSSFTKKKKELEKSLDTLHVHTYSELELRLTELKTNKNKLKADFKLLSNIYTNLIDKQKNIFKKVNHLFVKDDTLSVFENIVFNSTSLLTSSISTISHKLYNCENLINYYNRVNVTWREAANMRANIESEISQRALQAVMNSHAILGETSILDVFKPVKMTVKASFFAAMILATVFDTLTLRAEIITRRLLMEATTIADRHAAETELDKSGAELELSIETMHNSKVLFITSIYDFLNHGERLHKIIDEKKTIYDNYATIKQVKVDFSEEYKIITEEYEQSVVELARETFCKVISENQAIELESIKNIESQFREISDIIENNNRQIETRKTKLVNFGKTITALNSNMTESFASIIPNNWELLFNVDVNGNVDLTENLQLRLGWMLGFRAGCYKPDIVEGAAVTSEGICLVSPPRYLFISINDGQKSQGTGLVAAYSQSSLDSNIMTRINCAATMDSTKVFKCASDVGLSNQLNRTRQYFGPVNISRLHIQVLDEYGRHVSLNHMDWSLTLVFDQLYD